jgi:hypothetical protein
MHADFSLYCRCKDCTHLSRQEWLDYAKCVGAVLVGCVIAWVLFGGSHDR